MQRQEEEVPRLRFASLGMTGRALLEFLLALLTAGTVAALLVPLLKQRIVRTDRHDSGTAGYRDPPAEVERERLAGSLPGSEATAARTEIERRLLAAADLDSSLGPRHSSAASSSSFNRFLTPALCLV